MKAKAVVVRYQTRPDAADSNQQLTEQVLAELNAADPGGIRVAGDARDPADLVL